MTAKVIVNKLLEADDLDAPNMDHWSERLAVEERLDQLFGSKGEPRFPSNPDSATHWEGWFTFMPYSVYAKFTIFYKVQDAPSGVLSYEIRHRDWQHHNGEQIAGRFNILKMIELLERGMAKLKAEPPKAVTDVVRVFEKPLNYAYNVSHYGNDGGNL